MESFETHESKYQNLTAKKAESNLNKDTVQSVFREARKASESLRLTTLDFRLNCLTRLRNQLLDEKLTLVAKLAEETGKTQTDALTSEIFGLCDVIGFLLKNAAKMLKDKKVATPLALMGKPSYVVYEPRGVVLVISPWNYPLYQTLVPSLFSFVAGNATVIKPSEHTPLTGVLEKLLNKAKFPENSIQVLYGAGDVGSEAISAGPDYISFTGGVVTGKKIMRLASENLIPIELELGGKDPLIAFADIDFKRTVAGAIWGSFTNSGQSCSSVERIFVEEKIYEAFLKEFVAGTKALVLESKNPHNLDFGKMTLESQIKKVQHLVDDAKSKGATVHCGGQWKEGSFVYPPTVLTGVNKSMLVFHEEIFGPVVVMDSFKDEDDAVQKANDSDFGLSASVWCKDLTKASRVARHIKTGNVSINNVMLTEGNAALPFGGRKLSGFGQIKGTEGLHSFCHAKSIIVDKQSSKIEANWYPYTEKKFKLFSEFVEFFRGGLSGLITFAKAGLPLESAAQKSRLELGSGTQNKK